MCKKGQSKLSIHDMALIYAIVTNDADFVSLSISNGVNINNQSNKGVTPIMEALERNRMSIVKILLLNGAFFPTEEELEKKGIEVSEELTKWMEENKEQIEAARAKRLAEEGSEEGSAEDDKGEEAGEEDVDDDNSEAAEGDNLSLEPVFSIDLSGLFNLGESVVADEVAFPAVTVQYELDILKDEDGSKGLEAALSEIVQRTDGVEVTLLGDLYETALNSTVAAEVY